ncbi:uncharacterized protein TRIADDRAFT_50028 [Trichoplax adhaerens]|uniref:cyclin-dependent kinase n=1 Tax=Trichoplax adhaerens TaxID=10228 RepID=B3RS77_TRIAD|nr:hypothetical protein TRIADDRAFT_50028 [Trichoplax adhaerens]EDV26468.1 hypothetical protein TRIADDRAFT_50028 [Trichoplax adhaerens]|eukprot:XP_002110464.1 hypothetical protein TRIADDRAFT_50028 [Trichoplax adhaerens]
MKKLRRRLSATLLGLNNDGSATGSAFGTNTTFRPKLFPFRRYSSMYESETVRQKINAAKETIENSGNSKQISNQRRHSAAIESPSIPFGTEDAYEKLEPLGEGSYATVYKGYSIGHQKLVALKEITLNEEEGTPFTAIREASLLKQLKHANIVVLHDIIQTPTKLTFVFEYVTTDLSQYLNLHPGGLNMKNVKLFLYQLLRGLSYCHQRRILHRDIKPQNILVSEIGEIKLADFGLARAKSVPSKTYSPDVVTLWYRPPDVLLGSTNYSTSLDIWGVGCIFTEMVSGIATFPGVRNISDQLDKIWHKLGTPTEETWPGVTSYPEYCAAETMFYESRTIAEVIPRLMKDPGAADLATKMLQYQPFKRIFCQAAMNHQYFTDIPEGIIKLPPTVSIFCNGLVKLAPEENEFEGDSLTSVIS